MKKGTKITVFIASMALTIGSLMTIAGSQHRICGMHGGNICAPGNYNQECNGTNPPGDSK